MPIRIGDKEVQTRKERRKEARQAKTQQRLHAWALHQAGKRRRAQKEAGQEQPPAPTNPSPPLKAKVETASKRESSTSAPLPEAASEKKNAWRNGRKMVERKAKRGRTKFEEFLERETQKTAQTRAEEDLALERKLAKKLKVKGGKLGGFDDGMADLLDGLDEEAGFMGMEDDDTKLRSSKKRKVEVTTSLSRKQGKEKHSSGVKKDMSKKSLTSDLKSSMEDVDGSDSEDSMQDMFMDDEESSSGESGEDSEEGGHSVGDSDVEDEEELGVGLRKDANETGSDSDQAGLLSDEDAEVSGSDEGEEEEDEDEEEEEDEVISSDEEEKLKEEKLTKGKKSKKGGREEEGGKKEEGAAVKYVPPHLREKVSSESEEMARIQRRVRGLLNRLSEANVESISSDVSLLFQAHGRRMVTEIVTNEIIGACCGGPRGNDQYAAVFAAYVAGTAAMVGVDFGAKFLASLASAIEEQYAKEDSLALRNLTLLFANLYSFSLLPSELVFEVLAMLCKRFEELDVATILTLLQSCGMGLRAADPASMKDFVVSVQQRTAELKASLSSGNNGNPVSLGKRVQFMLDMICDIKNNKRRAKDDPAHHTRLKKWLQKLGVEDVQLRSVTWAKLMEPEKKGQWWLPGVAGDGGENSANVRAEVAGVMDAGAAEADRMLQLAASQRMNTDARRALFCIVMSAEDYIDAFEKILRLKLPGKQDREVVRVIVECCLQEQLYNKYYALLLTKLCHHEKNHKFSFQYCLWDHLKLLDSMELRRSTNLARLTASLIGSFSLSLSIVKVVDFVDVQKLTSKVMLHFRVMFEYLLADHSDDVVWGVFSRIAIAPELAALRDGLALFLHQHFSRDAAKKAESAQGAVLAKRCKLAKKALANVAGVPFGSQSREA